MNDWWKWRKNYNTALTSWVTLAGKAWRGLPGGRKTNSYRKKLSRLFHSTQPAAINKKPNSKDWLKKRKNITPVLIECITVNRWNQNLKRDDWTTQIDSFMIVTCVWASLGAFSLSNYQKYIYLLVASLSMVSNCTVNTYYYIFNFEISFVWYVPG